MSAPADPPPALPGSGRPALSRVPVWPTRALATLLLVTLTLLAVGCAAQPRLPAIPGVPGLEPPPPARPAPPPDIPPEIRWRDSRALGLPHDGRLVRGVRLPADGTHFFTWDPVRDASPNRAYRRWATDDTLRRTLLIAAAHRRAHPRAPRLAIGDLSRPRGGDFGERFGGVGHVSHQNGRDVDVYYPRRDRRELAPTRPGQVDQRLSQDLVDRFVAAGAEKVFVGPNLDLRGPPRVVQKLTNHDDHLHARFPRAPRA